MNCKTLHEVKQMSLLHKKIQYLGHILSTKGIQPLPLKTQAIQTMHPTKTPKLGSCFSQISRLLHKIHQTFCKNS